MPVEDLHATIFHALGIPPDLAYVNEKRPVYVTRDGQGQSRQGALRMTMTRRAFIGTGLMAPLILKAQDKAGTKAPVLGEGEFKYEAIHNWGELPSHIKWGNTHNVVEDAQGHIHVHHTVHATSESGDTVVVFDRAGKFVRSWGQEFRGVAHGLWIQKEGREEFLYLTANAANPRMQPPPALPSTIVKATLKGEIVYKIQGPARHH